MPAEIPVTTPVAGLAVAIAIFALDHTPPMIASLSVVVMLIHVLAVPVIGDVKIFTVIINVAWQPVAYE